MLQSSAHQNRPKNWTNIYFFLSTPILALILAPLHLYYFGWNWAIMAFAVVYWGVGELCITGGYHRLFSHRSYEAKPWVRFLYLFFGAGAFQGPALIWATDHRLHHRYVDTDRDPYNIKEGFWYAHLGWMLLHEPPDRKPVFPHDLENDRMVSWQNRHYVALAIFSGFLVPMLFGLWVGDPLGGLIWGGLVRLVTSHHCTFFINSLCHMIGTQPYNDTISARDSVLMAFLAFGEGYHNFHHAFQSDYRNGIRWYQWDPTKWMLGSLKWTGAVYNLKTAPASVILRARMALDQKHLLQIGVPAETIQSLKERVEKAQVKWRELREEYERLKSNISETSKQRYLTLKAEMRVAKLEFKMSFRQWRAYRNTLGTLPSTSL